MSCPMCEHKSHSHSALKVGDKIRTKKTASSEYRNTEGTIVSLPQEGGGDSYGVSLVSDNGRREVWAVFPDEIEGLVTESDESEDESSPEQLMSSNYGIYISYSVGGNVLDSFMQDKLDLKNHRDYEYVTNQKLDGKSVGVLFLLSSLALARWQQTGGMSGFSRSSTNEVKTLFDEDDSLPRPKVGERVVSISLFGGIGRSGIRLEGFSDPAKKMSWVKWDDGETSGELLRDLIRESDYPKTAVYQVLHKDSLPSSARRQHSESEDTDSGFPVRAKRFRHKKTGQISTRIPLLSIGDWEEIKDSEESAGAGDDLDLKDLNQFRGTESYTNVMGTQVTDGVRYVMESGYSWFITDAIVILRMKLKHHPFVAVKLKLSDHQAAVIYEDGDGKKLYQQDYKYTDAKRELDLFYTDGVLMLAQEY